MSYYQHHLFICTHQREAGETCCANHPAQTLLAYAKEQLKIHQLDGPAKCRVNKSGCMNRCSKGPIMVVYPEGVWYRYQNKDDIDEIIREHLQAGRVVERLKV